MKASSLLAEIRYDIADLRAHGYPDAILMEYINDGLCFIYSLRPELFTQSQVYKAKCGSLQCVGDCCDRLVSVDAITDCCGNTIDHVKQGSTSMARQFDKGSIPGGAARVHSFTKNNSKEFVVEPPVGANEELYFRITCTSPPKSVDATGELPGCFNHEALLRYVKYRVYGTETESATSMQLSDRHYQRMLELLGLQRKLIEEMVDTNDDKS